MAIATLIAAGALDDRLVADAAEKLGGQVAWLDRGDAARIHTSLDVASAREAMRYIDTADCVVTSVDFAPRLFVADMDSTMIGQECIDELAAEAGVGERVANITERAMRGELDFVGALTERLALIEGLEATVIGNLLKKRIRPNPGAATLIATLKAKGVRTILVSGGFTAFAEPIGAMLGFDRVVANQLGQLDGLLTGRVVGPIVNSATKRAVLEEEAARLGGHSIAIGDGANDLPMLEAADLGIAYLAKPRVAEAADVRIDHNRLDALLWALGFPKAEWIAP